jgi:hypothetical protein
MKTVKLLGLLLLAAFVVSGCAAVAHVEKDETVNFSRYKTFAWTQSALKDSVSQARVSDLTERALKEAVAAELEKEGWRETKATPDVLLAYDIVVEKTLRDENNPLYTRPFTRTMFNPYTRRWFNVFYPSQFMGYQASASEVREGTVTITMADAATEKTIWQGWTTNQVSSRNISSKEIRSGVKNIFRKWDVAQR